MRAGGVFLCVCFASFKKKNEVRNENMNTNGLLALIIAAS